MSQERKIEETSVHAGLVAQQVAAGQLPDPQLSGQVLKDTKERLEAHKLEAKTPLGVKAVEDMGKVLERTGELLADTGAGIKVKELLEHGWKASQEVPEMMPPGLVAFDVARAAVGGHGRGRLLQLARLILQDSVGLTYELAYSKYFREQLKELVILFYQFFGGRVKEVGGEAIEQTKETASLLSESMKEVGQRVMDVLPEGTKEKIVQTVGGLQEKFGSYVEAGKEKLEQVGIPAPEILTQKTTTTWQQKEGPQYKEAYPGVSGLQFYTPPVMEPVGPLPPSPGLALTTVEPLMPPETIMTPTTPVVATVPSYPPTSAFATYPSEKGDESVNLSALSDVKEKVSDMAETMTEAKEKAGELVQKLKLSDEEVEQLNHRFRNILSTISSNARYTRLVTHIVEFLNELKSSGVNIATVLTWDLEEAAQAENVRGMWNDIRSLVEEFAPGRFDPFIDSVVSTFREILKDETLISWYNDFSEYLVRALQNPDLLNDESTIQEGKQLLRRGSGELNYNHFRPYLDTLQGNFLGLISAIETHPTIASLQTEVSQLVSDLLEVDQETGLVRYRWSALQDLKNVFKNMLSEQLMYIPLPRLEGEDENMMYAIESGVLRGEEILPDKIAVEARQVAEMNLAKQEAERMEAWLKVYLRGVTLKLRDIHFWFKRKTFPQIEDRGIAQMEVRNADITMTILLQKEGAGFIPHRVECDIDKLNIHVDEARHDFLLNLYTSLWSTSLKKKFENRVEEVLRNMLNIINLMISATVKSLKSNVKILQAPPTIGEMFSKTVSDTMSSVKESL